MSPTWIPPNPNFKDLTGQRFGKLVVVRLIPPAERPKRKYHYTLWECKCDCGNTCQSRASDLQQGRINSCKCARNTLAGLTPEERLAHKRARQLDWQRRNKDKIAAYYRKKNPPGEKKPLRFTEEELAIRRELRKKHADTYNEKWAQYKRCQRHGVSFQKYLEMLEAQGGVCAICKGHQKNKKRAFCIDHDHACCIGKRGCGKCVRGLLCDSCNWMLGSAYDSIERLQAAIDYLKKWQTKPAEVA